tara:strand:- start:3113 stop:3346 length:234 start_codon:yes stop_codon:yes gene_type:complete
MFYTLHIPNKKERLKVAMEIQNIIQTSKEYTPKDEQCDIGIQAEITEKELQQILGLLKRRGYRYSKRESRTESALTL